MYTHEVTYVGANISLLKADRIQFAVGLKLVPKLNPGETPKPSYSALKFNYSKQSDKYPLGVTNDVRVDGPGWFAAFGGAHLLIAGEVGRTYEVTVAEECKELEFPVDPQVEGFGAAAAVSGTVKTSTTKQLNAAAGATPAAAGDGVSIAGARAVRIRAVPVNAGAFFNLSGVGNQRFKGLVSDDGGATFRRCRDIDWQIVEATDAAAPGWTSPLIALPVGPPNNIYAWTTDGIGVSAGTDLNLTMEAFS